MNLICHYFENPIQLNENEIIVISIEDKEVFSKFVLDMHNSLNGKSNNFMLFKGLEEVNLSNSLLFVTDYLTLYSEKKFLTKIYKQLEDKVQDTNLEEEFHVIKNKIFSFVDDVIFDYEIELSQNLDYPLSAVLKLVNVQVENTFATIFESIISFLHLVSALNVAKVVVFINLKQFLSENQLLEIYKTANYQKINIVLIENHVSLKLDYEKHIILDRDLCEIIV